MGAGRTELVDHNHHGVSQKPVVLGHGVMVDRMYPAGNSLMGDDDERRQPADERAIGGCAVHDVRSGDGPARSMIQRQGLTPTRLCTAIARTTCALTAITDAASAAPVMPIA